MNSIDIQQCTVKLLKTLADPTRLHIVASMATGGEEACGQICRGFDLAQPTMCHHFSRLVEADILLLRKVGTMNYYRLNTELLDALGINVQVLASHYNKQNPTPQRGRAAREHAMQ